ncbi:MAG TPA: c-type cytochrome [Burkholderiaceae bacterium]|nr:c-type cytochrome [Burkholderiaceae bacterium]
MKSFKLLPIVMALALVGCGEKTEQPAASASAEQAAPAASASVAAAAPAASEAAPVATPVAASASAAAVGDLAKGEQVYNNSCLSCHGAGVLGAPKFGDKTAWAPRAAKGKDTLYSSALNGFQMMPPRGGNASLSDADVKAAVDYMVAKAS